MFEWDLWVFSHNSDRRLENWKLHILHNCIHQHDPTKISLRLKVYSKFSSKIQTPEYFFFLQRTFEYLVAC